MTKQRNLEPQAVEAEEAVLGAVLVNPAAIIDVSFLRADDFFIVRNGWIWDVMTDLHHQGEPIDYLIVLSALEQRGKLKETGGAAYVLSLINKTPSALNIDGYGRIVQRMSIRRRLVGAANKVLNLAYKDELAITEVMEASEKAIARIVDDHVSTIETTQPIKEIAGDMLEEAALWRTNPQDVRGLASGLYPLDVASGGFETGLLYEIAGRPGMGKSALLARSAWGAALNGAGVVIFSLEMNKRAFVRRMAVQKAWISATALKYGKLSDDEWDRFLQATDLIARLPILVEARSNLSIQEMRAIVRRHQREASVNLVMVDTMNRIHADGTKQYERMTQISHGMADWAHESPYPILTAVQLSRANQQLSDKRPTLEALRDSGAVEEDADWIGGLHREYYYARTEEARANMESKRHVAELLVLKNRDGDSEIGAEMYWDARCVGFERLDKTSVKMDEFTTYVDASQPRNGDKELAR